MFRNQKEATAAKKAAIVAPSNTTHVYVETNYSGNVVVEFYKEIGVSSCNNPMYVRWIKSRNSWAVKAQAFDHVKHYAVKIGDLG